MKKITIINIALSVLTAVLLLLSTASFGFSVLVFIAFVPLFFAIRMGGLKPIFSGWIVGFIYWTVGLSWMTTIFGHFGGAPIYATIALLLLVAISGGFFFFAIFGYIAGKKNNAVLLALVFIILEMAKSELFFAGVPWLNLAQSQYKNIVVLQSLSVLGEFGLSFMIMLVNIFIFRLLAGENFRKNAVALCVIVTLIFIPGIIRNFAPLKIDGYARVKIIQTGLKQEDKWNKDKIFPMVSQLNSTLMSIDRNKFDLIVMPESAYPARIQDTPFIMDVISNVTFDTPIIAGSDRVKIGENGQETYYNTMFFFYDGTKSKMYDKIHLTPFGEYFPFEKVLEPIKLFFFGPGALFTPGTESVVFEYKNMKIAPLICFESAFSKLVATPVRMGANMIAIISNDSWFGEKMGRIQHLAVDSMRAAEYSRSAVRSTQDGISAVILPDGSIPVTLSEAKAAQIDYDVPLVSSMTIYSYVGNYWIFALIIIVLIMEKRRKNREKH